MPTENIQDDQRRYVNVLFGTNRGIDAIDNKDQGSIKLTNISSELGHTLKLGVALVRVPEAHKVGAVETPDVTIFGIKLYKGAGEESKHFTLKEILVLSRDRAVRFLRENSEHAAMIFIHGYNTSFENAVFKTAQIAFDAHFSGVPIVFSWPSKNSVVLMTMICKARSLPGTVF